MITPFDVFYYCYSLRVIPQYLIYRPANSVPYATVEADLKGQCLKYCTIDPKAKLITQTISEVEQKCSTFQHWIHQWTHGNLLVTQMEGGTQSNTDLLPKELVCLMMQTLLSILQVLNTSLPILEL